MKAAFTQERLAGACAWLYGVWQALGLQHGNGLRHAWLNSPYDRAGFPAFLLWMIPPAVLLFRGAPARQAWFAAGVLVTLAGSLGEVNAVKYLGLAVTTAGFLPGRLSWLHLAAAVCWMPVFGYALRSAGQPAVHAARIVVALSATVLTLRPPAFLK